MISELAGAMESVDAGTTMGLIILVLCIGEDMLKQHWSGWLGQA